MLPLGTSLLLAADFEVLLHFRCNKTLRVAKSYKFRCGTDRSRGFHRECGRTYFERAQKIYRLCCQALCRLDEFRPPI